MASANLTPRELEILVAFVTETKTDVDWDKVATKANCNTAKYARDKFALIKNKLAASLEGVQANANGTATTNGGTPKTKSAKKTPASKRKNEDGTTNGEEESPTKKAKPAARKPKSTAPAKSKSATPGDTKVTPPAEANEDEGPQIKPEPNEAGELMDELVGTD